MLKKHPAWLIADGGSLERASFCHEPFAICHQAGFFSGLPGDFAPDLALKG
jgi:hypothetical protein